MVESVKEKKGTPATTDVDRFDPAARVQTLSLDLMIKDMST